MRRKTTLICIILSVIVLMTGCSGNEKYSGRESIAISGNTLAITYDSNPDGGCIFTHDISDDTVLQYVDDQFTLMKLPGEDEGTIAPGRGGTDTLTFKGLKEGTATITFTYGQQWKGGSVDAPWKVKVNVGPGGQIISAK